MKKSKSIHTTASEKETFALAKNLARPFRGKEIILLTGELGAGKTIFAKGIVAGLGLQDVHQVCSPSFTLVNIYQARYPVFHIDLYRLENENEIEDLGWEEYLDHGIVIVEWAEKLSWGLESIGVTIEVLPDESRRITITHDNLGC